MKLDLFDGMSTAVAPRQWQLLYYPADQCSALDLGKPQKVSIKFSETLELMDFPLDRQLLNIRYAKIVPPLADSIENVAAAAAAGNPDDAGYCAKGHVGEKYAACVRYKVSQHLLSNEEWKFYPAVVIKRPDDHRDNGGGDGKPSRRSPPHVAIRLERKIERTFQMVVVPQFLIVGAVRKRFFFCAPFSNEEQSFAKTGSG